jgi:hypothetical protein
MIVQRSTLKNWTFANWSFRDGIIQEFLFQHARAINYISYQSPKNARFLKLCCYHSSRYLDSRHPINNIPFCTNLGIMPRWNEKTEQFNYPLSRRSVQCRESFLRQWTRHFLDIEPFGKLKSFYNVSSSYIRVYIYKVLIHSYKAALFLKIFVLSSRAPVQKYRLML